MVDDRRYRARDERGREADADNDLGWPGKRPQTIKPAPGGPLDPGKHSVTGDLRFDATGAFDRTLADGRRAITQVRAAIAARDFTAAVAAGSALRRHLEVARQGATSGREHRDVFRPFEVEARIALEQAPDVSNDALRERFHSAKGAPSPTWDAEQRGWEGRNDAPAIAERGIAGSPTALPHLDRIQASFGRHDVSGVRAHLDGDAAGAASELGARAFAFGDDVAFAQAPELFTAAHEAAHVVQQRAGVALSGGAASDIYEEHADHVAHAVVAGRSAEALLDVHAARGSSAAPIVQRDTLTRGTPKPPSLEPPSWKYCNTYRHKIWIAILNRIEEVRLPQPHPRLHYGLYDDAQEALANVFFEERDLFEATTLHRLMELVYQVDLQMLVDEVRQMPDPDKWHEEVGVAIAAAFTEPLDASIRRMGLRLRVQLDAHGYMSQVGDLVASCPLDLVVAKWLKAKGVINMWGTEKAKKTDDTQGKEFLNGAKPVVDFEWVDDPKLWNWIHVKKPATGVTIEDVAVTPMLNGEAMGSHLAYRIAASPPYFGIPIEVARQIDEARHHATGAGLVDADSNHFPRVASATLFHKSVTSDDAALAQAPKPPTGTPDLPRLLDRVDLQLNVLQTTLGPWETIAVLFKDQPAFVARRRAELAKDPKAAAKWIGAIAVQERVLHAVSSEVSAIVDDLTDRKVKPGSDDTPHAIGQLLFSYARVAAASHLAAEAGPLLAKARTERALLPLSLTEDQFRGMQAAVANQRFASAGATKSERDADANIAKAPELVTRLADLRLRISRGDPMDAKEQQRLTTEGAELGMRARLTTLAASVRALLERADAVGLTHDPHPGGGWSVAMLCTMILDLIYRSEKPHAQHEDPDEPHGGWMERLDLAKHDTHDPAKAMAAAVATIDKEMKTILEELGPSENVKERGFESFKKYVLEQIHDQEVRNLINSIMLQVGLMIITGEIAGAGLAAIRGIALAGEIATDVRGAGLLWKGAEIVTHAGLQTVAGGAAGGEISGRAFAENALGMVFTSAAMKPFHALLHGSEALEKEVIQTWGQLGKKAAKVGAELVLSTGTGILASSVAHSLVNNTELSVAGADEWTTQGISLAASMFVSSRTAGMHQRIERATSEYGTKDFRDLMKRTEELARRSHTTKNPTREEVAAMLEERQSILVAERAALVKVGGRSQKLIADNSAEIHDVTALVELPLQLAGLSSVVDGHAYEGTGKQVREALDHGKKFGVELTAKQDPLTGIWTVEASGRKLTIRELDFKRHTAGSAAGSLGNAQSLGGNRYAAPAGDLRELRAGHAKDPDAHASEIRYDAMRNVAYYEADVEVGGRRERLHIESKLATKVTGFSELATFENAIIGHPVSLADGHDIISRLNVGDASGLAKVGLAGTGKLPGGSVEYGLGLTSDHQVVVVRGSNAAEVDWSHLPGITPIAHTHPDVAGNDLPMVDGEHAVRVSELVTKTDRPSTNREKVFPSGGDVILMGSMGIDGHIVYTPYVVKRGKVMKAARGDTGPRLVFTIGKPVEAGMLNGQRVYRSTMTGTFDGDHIVDQPVWTVQEGGSIKGHHWMEEPKGMIPKAGIDRAAAVHAMKTPAHVDLPHVASTLEAAARKSLGSTKHEPFTVEALSADAFEKRFRSGKGNAVFVLEDGHAKVYVHEAATEPDVIAEMYHLRQLSDPKLGPEIRHLYGTDLGNWDQLSVPDRLEIFRRKLAIEIASHEAIIHDPHAGADTVDNQLKMNAAAQLADLHGLAHDVDAITPEAMSRFNAHLDPMPGFLTDPAYLFNKRRDPSLAGNKTKAQTSSKQTPVTDSTQAKAGTTVVQTGDVWQERWQITSGYDGVLTYENTAAGEVAVVTTSSGKRHVYDLEANAKPRGGRKKRKVESGDVLIDEQARNYRRVKIIEGGKTRFTEEIQLGSGKWRERGSEISKKGTLLEDAAKLQIDKELTDAGASFKRVPHQAADGTGFDDVVAVFTYTNGKATGARVRIREVKNYPGRYVPVADFTAIRDNLETNMTDLRESINDALDKRREGKQVPEQFKGWKEDQLRAVQKALALKAVDFEIVIGPDTMLGDTGANNSVLGNLSDGFGKYGKLTTSKKPGSKHGEATRVGQEFVDEARAAKEAAGKTKGKP